MGRKEPMRVLVLAGTKGGVGKTTLASILAVRAFQDGGRVALIDTDAQSSLERWWELRGEPENPQLIEVDASPEGLEWLLSEGWQWAIIDTPPGGIASINDAVSCATFVLIPSRASAVDVEAVDKVVDLCNDHGKPFAFVLNAVPHGWGKLADSASAYLAQCGPVLKARVASRKPYVAAMTVGKSGAEIDRAAREEIDTLWAEVKRAVAKAEKAVR